MSPLQELRGTHGLSAAQFAAVLGITYSQLYQAEHGLQQVPRKAWEVLSEMGVDVDRLRSRQAEWFEERTRQLREDLAGKIACTGVRGA